jgi:type VI secretion system secreted protein VgrG
MAKWSQAARSLTIGVPSPLEPDDLLLQSVDMTDELGRPFVCELRLYSEKTDINFDDIVGQNVTIILDQGEGGLRYINGFVSRFSQGGGASGDHEHMYEATVVPWLWFLTRSTDCRIFQEMTIPDIVKQIFTDFGCSELVEFNLRGTYDALEYVVQYRETAFNFVSRLMEHEGIYYFFKHENGKHKLVVCDGPGAHETVEGYEEVPCHETSKTDSQGVLEWSRESRVMPGKYSLRDFDFKVPGKDLNSEKEIAAEHAHSDHPVFDYPGDYIEKSSGDNRAAARMEELAVQNQVFRARSDARGLTVGSKFKLTGASRDDDNAEYVITSMKVKAREESFGEQNSDEEVYESEFTCIPAETPFRPARATLKPLINGPQTAIVSGPDGEEVLTDEFGRVKVHFHWDRWNEADDKCSCWIRVAQIWAGKSFGAMFLPRIGQEVIVEFLEGDPDRPIVTGRVYNGECQVPYDLPDNKTMSTIKSDSSKGGGGFNELRFEDKKDEEEIFVHAQKDMQVRVLNDTKEWIGNDRHLFVTNDQIEEVDHDRNEKVTNDHKEEIGNDRNLTVKGKEAVSITGSKSLTVEGDVLEVFKADHSEKTTGQVTIKADTIVIEGATNITLKVGGSTIAIEDGSINIKTGDFTIETDGDVKVKAGGDFKSEATGALEGKGMTVKHEGSSTADLKGATTTVEGSGTASVKGGQVMLG